MNMLSHGEVACESYGITDQGCVRDHNEDAFLDAAEQGFWVVADGAGGHDAGEVASQLIVEKLSKIKRPRFFGNLVAKVKQTLQRINTELIELSGGEATPSLIASTVSVLMLQKQRVVYLWSGDSRIYLLRDKQLSQLSRDHNRVDEFIKAGFSPEDAENYPLAQYLTAAVGVSSPLYTETQTCEVKTGDVFLLCSDGLFKELSDKEIEEYLQHGSLEDKAKKLMEVALSRQATDNVTVLVVRINKL